MLTEKIRRQLSANRLEEAFDLLLSITRGRDGKAHDQLVLLLSNYNANAIRTTLGTINFEQAVVEQNKTVAALLGVLAEVEQGDYIAGLSESSLDRELAGRDQARKKLLFIAANPHGTPKFELEREYLDLRRIFRKKRAQFEITELFNATLDGFYEIIGEERPSILHLALPSTDTYLALHKHDDSIHAIPYSLLASSFALLRPYVNCIFLNTHTSPIFLKKVSRILGYAIGWENQVADEVSVYFSAGYYTAIAQGESLESAFKTGVKLLENYQGNYKLGMDSILLFKDGNCINKEDNYQEAFLQDGYKVVDSDTR